MLYREWMGEWLGLYVKPTVKERTYRKYRAQAEQYILPEFGDREINAIGAVELQKFSVRLSQRALAANTVNGILSVLRSSLKKAVLLGVAETQYTGAIVRPKLREKKVACFGKEEQKKIEKYVLEHDMPYLFGMLLSLYTGLRIGELLALTWDDVDFGKALLTVSKSCHDSWKNGHYCKVLDTTKTISSERVIPLPGQIVVFLKEIKRETNGKYVVAGRSEYGAQVRTYQRAFDRLLKKLGIEHKGFHALRHTFATRALEVGMDVKTLSELLGHKNPVVTLQRYAHSLLEHKAEMMNKVGKLLFPALSRNL